VAAEDLVHVNASGKGEADELFGFVGGDENHCGVFKREEREDRKVEPKMTGFGSGRCAQWRSFCGCVGYVRGSRGRSPSQFGMNCATRLALLITRFQLGFDLLEEKGQVAGLDRAG
jgi:hypothetical protein